MINRRDTGMYLQRPLKTLSRMTVRLLLAAVILMLLSVVSAQEEYNTVTMVSMTNNIPGNDNSGQWLDMTPDGRYIVYGSNASNLVAGDNFDCGEYFASDVFVYDRLTRQNTLMTVSSSGVQGTVTTFNYLQYVYGCVINPSISDDGRFVAFGSLAENLVPGDTNQRLDLFLHDRDTNSDGIFDEPGAISTIRINPQEADGSLSSAQISGNGRYIVFKYSGHYHFSAMVYDRLTGESVEVETASDGTPANIIESLHGNVAISKTGRFVTFISRATNLVPNDTNNAQEIFLRDRDADNNGIYDEPGKITIDRIMLTEQGLPTTCNPCDHGTDIPFVSADGQTVIFSTDQLLIPGVFGWHIYVRDRQSQKTILISKASDGTVANDYSYAGTISNDGRFVTFTSSATNLLVGQTTVTDGTMHTFIHDRDADNDGIYDEAGAVTTSTVSAEVGGTTTGGEGIGVTSDDGAIIVFASYSRTLVDYDTAVCTSSYATANCTDVFYAMPSPLSPANLTATKISEIQIDLTWIDRATDEANYRVERKKEGEANWQELAVLPANATTYTDNDLSCGVYHYRVKAYRGTDGLFSRPSKMATAEEISCDEAVVLLAPTDGETVGVYPVLQWVAYPGADSYKVRLRDFFDENIFNMTFEAGSLCAAGVCSLNLADQDIELVNGEEYEWRIQSKSEFAKVKSRIRTFEVEFAVPGAFALISPASDSTVDSLNPVFSWQAAQNTEEYRIRVKDSFDDTKMLKLNLTPQQANCVNGICTIDSSLFDYRNPLVDGGEYAWRVQARNSLGRTKSAKWEFEVDSAARSGRLTLP